MNPAVDEKVHKCKHPNKDVCVKACIREHNRLVKMNDRYSQIRKMLGLSPKTTKVKTLVKTIQHIKMLKQVLDASDEAKAIDTGPNGNVQLMKIHEPDTAETAEELDQKYTPKEAFHPGGPENTQILAIPAETKEMPCQIKLPAFKTDTNTANDAVGHCNVLENGSNSSCKPMPIDSGDFVEHQTRVPPVHNLSSTSNNEDAEYMHIPIQVLVLDKPLPSFACAFYNIRPSAIHNPSSTPNNENAEYLHIPKHETDVDKPLPSFASSPDNIKQSALKNSSSDVVQQSEPMGKDCSLTAEVERNLGEVKDVWLSYDLLKDDNFYDRQDRLTFMDTNSMAENDMEDLFACL